MRARCAFFPHALTPMIGYVYFYYVYYYIYSDVYYVYSDGRDERHIHALLHVYYVYDVYYFYSAVDGVTTYIIDAMSRSSRSSTSRSRLAAAVGSSPFYTVTDYVYVCCIYFVYCYATTSGLYSVCFVYVNDSYDSYYPTGKSCDSLGALARGSLGARARF